MSVRRYLSVEEMLAVTPYRDGARAVVGATEYEFLYGQGWVRQDRPADVELLPAAGGLSGAILRGQGAGLQAAYLAPGAAGDAVIVNTLGDDLDFAEKAAPAYVDDSFVLAYALGDF